MPVPQQPGSPWSNKHRPVLIPAETFDSTSINISFKDITMTAKAGPGHKSKQILKGLSGNFKSGELTAILGPSGAGKTSLLNILTGFRTDGMRGTLMSNDKVVEPSKNTARKKSAYILQEDQLCPVFTVQEIMNIAAQLKLGNSLPENAKNLLITDILDNLSMKETKDTRCSQLSGGQRKRLSIALELIDNPSVIYLDEPTTGLDSSSTLQLIRLLATMAHQGKAVICTVHQPSATIFEMLDHVYVVASGKCVYQGTSKNVVLFLESINLPCPKYHNPADFLLDVVSGEFGDYMDKLRMNGSNPTWRDGVDDKLKDGLKTLQWSDKAKATVLITPPSEIQKSLIIMKSILLQIHRNWTTTYFKLVLHILLGLLIGVFFSNSGIYGNRTINNLGFFMGLIVYSSFLTFLPATVTFPLHAQVLMKERFNNWYNFKTYFAAFFIINSPLQVLYISTFVIITFFLSNQLFDYYRLSMFIVVGALNTLISEYFGIAMGSLSKPANALFNGSVFLTICLILAGFAILLPHMPIFFYYVSYVSYMRFCLELLVTSTYGQGRPALPCPDSEHYCQVKQPSIVLDRMGIDEDNFTFSLTFLCCYTFAMVVIAFFCIRRSIKGG